MSRYAKTDLLEKCLLKKLEQYVIYISQKEYNFVRIIPTLFTNKWNTMYSQTNTCTARNSL